MPDERPVRPEHRGPTAAPYPPAPLGTVAQSSAGYAAWLLPAPRDGLGTAALILGSVGTVAAISFFGVPLGLPLGILAVVLGAAGRRRVRRGEASNGAQALAGLVLGAVAVLVSVAMIGLLATSVTAGWLGPGAALTSALGSYDEPLGPQGTASFDDGTQVTVSAARSFAPPSGADGYHGGDRAYRFTVTVRNTGDRDLDLGDYTYNATAGDDEADLGLISTDHGELAGDFPGTLAPGRSVTVPFAFDVPVGLAPLHFDFEPTTGHEDAYWRLDLA